MRRIKVAVAVVLLGAAGFSPAFSGVDATADDTSASLLPVVEGVGEEMLVVTLAETFTVEQAAGRLEEINRRFGELQGLYLAATDHYEVLGLFVQTSPDAITVQCPDAGAVFEAEVEGSLIDLECPTGLTSVQVLQPVELSHVPIEEYPALQFPAPCGAVGQPPCQAHRYEAVLTDDLGLPPGRTLALSAFRTKRGAQEFVELARAAGIGEVVLLRVRKLGGGDVGLGQEPHPDGSGPLLGPLPDPQRYQTA